VVEHLSSKFKAGIMKRKEKKGRKKEKTEKREERRMEE
jgi:hypothetical protein